MRSPVKPLLLLFTLLPASAAGAGETLDSVLDRAATQKEAAIDYREVRHLQLLSEPWQGEGRIYLSGYNFVIDQHAPQQQIMVADRTRIWLLLPERNIRRSMMLTAPTAQKSLALIKPIMRGDRKSLEQHFDIAFTDDEGSWRIELVPKEAEESYYSRIVVSGPDGRAAEQMVTELADGDYSEWSFSQQPFDKATEAEIERLIKAAKGI